MTFVTVVDNLRYFRRFVFVAWLSTTPVSCTVPGMVST